MRAIQFLGNLKMNKNNKNLLCRLCRSSQLSSVLELASTPPAGGVEASSSTDDSWEERHNLHSKFLLFLFIFRFPRNWIARINQIYSNYIRFISLLISWISRKLSRNPRDQKTYESDVVRVNLIDASDSISWKPEDE